MRNPSDNLEKSMYQFWQIHVTTSWIPSNYFVQSNNLNKTTRAWTGKAKQWSDLGPIKIQQRAHWSSTSSPNQGFESRRSLSVKISCPLYVACWNLKEEDKALAMEDAGWSRNGLSVLTSVPLRISIVEPFLPPRAVAPVTAGYPYAVTSFPPYPHPRPSGLRHPHKAQHAAASCAEWQEEKDSGPGTTSLSIVQYSHTNSVVYC